MVHHGWFNQFWLMRWVQDLMIQPLVQWLVGSNCGWITSKRPVLGPSLIFQTWGETTQNSEQNLQWMSAWRAVQNWLKMSDPPPPGGMEEWKASKWPKDVVQMSPWLWATRIDFAYSLAWPSVLASKKKQELKGKNYPGLSWTCPLRDPKVNNIGNMRHLIGPNTALLQAKGNPLSLYHEKRGHTAQVALMKAGLGRRQELAGWGQWLWDPNFMKCVGKNTCITKKNRPKISSLPDL